MATRWRFASGIWALFVNREYQGLISEDGGVWINYPHKPVNLPDVGITEKKQIALSIWTIQKSVGVE